MLPIDQYRDRFANIAFLLVEREEFRISDTLGFNERRNTDQVCRQTARRLLPNDIRVKASLPHRKIR